MIIPIPVGAIRRAAQKGRLEDQARRESASAAGIRCQVCGEVDLPIGRRRGNTLLHVFLYLAWILPGIVYGIWRSRVLRLHCRKCDAIMGVAPQT